MFNIKVRGAPPVSIHLVIFIKTDVFYHFGSLSPVVFFKREVLYARIEYKRLTDR